MTHWQCVPISLWAFLKKYSIVMGRWGHSIPSAIQWHWNPLHMSSHCVLPMNAINKYHIKESGCYSSAEELAGRWTPSFPPPVKKYASTYTQECVLWFWSPQRTICLWFLHFIKHTWVVELGCGRYLFGVKAISSLSLGNACLGSS